MPDEVQINIAEDVISAYQKSPKAERIFAIMGPNGAGKSRLLEVLEQTCRSQGIPVLRLPAIRTLSPPTPVSGTPSDAGPVALQTMLSAGPFNFSNALFWEADSFFKSATPRDNKFKDQLHAYYKRGKTGAEPAMPSDQIEELQQIISRLLRYDTKALMVTPPPIPGPLQQVRNQRGQMVTQPGPPTPQPPRPEINFTRNGTTFGSAGLSDGEKQIAMLAWMLAETQVKPFVFLVDEPELYLNEARAVEFWEQLEASFPATIFVYATHNVVFATRQRVSRTYMLGMDQRAEILPRDEPVPQSVIRDMVGARVQILRVSKPIIFCEDTLLRHIAADVLTPDDFEFVILEGWQTVVSAVSKESRSWSKIRSSLPHCGIIDRDARDDHEMELMAKKNVFCFPLFEAESLLVAPEVALQILSRKSGRLVENKDYVPVLLESAKRSKSATLAALAAHLRRWNSPHLEYSEADHAVTAIKVTGPEGLANKFEQRAAEIYRAIDDQDIAAVIRLFDGKQLCAHMANLSMPQFQAELGGHPQNDYDVLQQSEGFSAKLAQLGYLSGWAQKIRNHLAETLKVEKPAGMAE